MKNQIRHAPNSPRNQRGAVAIIVGLSLFILVGMLALVLDLGHLYVVKTELQNAADAAALSGAKELDGTVAGIGRAQTRAIEAAGLNKFDFKANSVTITAANLQVGSCPDDGCMVAITSVTSAALAADKTFIKVDTGAHTLSTWFAPIWNLVQTNTFGLAVAGRYTIDVSPIAVCRLPDQTGTVSELGYERGVTYKVSDTNPLGPGTMYWLDPESNTPGNCPVTSTNATLPYVCTGKVSYTPVVGQTVNTNTGISDPQLEALDSRFGVYNSKNKCDPSTAPSDTNVREYIYNSTTAGSPRDWMGTDPTRQSLRFMTNASGDYVPVPYLSRVALDYGVLWSAFRPTGATVSNWTSLYKQTATSYPEPSPYAQTSGNYFSASASSSKIPRRRVMNMVILECKSAGGVCRTATVLGVGQFFLQKKANTPSDKEVYVEFGGLLPTPLPTGEIRLYR